MQCRSFVFFLDQNTSWLFIVLQRCKFECACLEFPSWKWHHHITTKKFNSFILIGIQEVVWDYSIISCTILSLFIQKSKWQTKLLHVCTWIVKDISIPSNNTYSFPAWSQFELIDTNCVMYSETLKGLEQFQENYSLHRKL